MDDLIELAQRAKALSEKSHPTSDALRQTVTQARNNLGYLVSQLEAAVTAEEAKQAEVRTNNATFAAIPGFVDLSATPDTAAPAAIDEPVSFTVVRDGDTPVGIVVNDDQADEGDDDYDDEDDYEDDYEDYTPSAEPLAVTVVADGDTVLTTELVSSALEKILPSLRTNGAQHYYVVEDGTVTTTGARLVAHGIEQREPGASAGRRVMLAPVPELGVTLHVNVAGEVDPENPPADPIDQAIEQAKLYPDTPVPEVSIHLERLDTEELLVEDAARIAETHALPALASLIGEYTISEIVDGENPSKKVARLERGVEAGPLDAHVLNRAARFDGTLPFGALGRVRATARTS